MAVKTYTDLDGNTFTYPTLGIPPVDSDPPIYDSAVAQPLTSEDAARDKLGFTNPNLHRRLDNKDHSDSASTMKVTPKSQSIPKGAELDLRNYTLQIHKVNSYRTVEYILHDEDSTTSEIP